MTDDRFVLKVPREQSVGMSSELYDFLKQQGRLELYGEARIPGHGTVSDLDSGPTPLTEWLDEQRERAETRIDDDRVGEVETLRWKGERDLIDTIQEYLEMGVLELE